MNLFNNYQCTICIELCQENLLINYTLQNLGLCVYRSLYRRKLSLYYVRSEYMYIHKKTLQNIYTLSSKWANKALTRCSEQTNTTNHCSRSDNTAQCTMYISPRYICPMYNVYQPKVYLPNIYQPNLKQSQIITAKFLHKENKKFSFQKNG